MQMYGARACFLRVRLDIRAPGCSGRRSQQSTPRRRTFAVGVACRQRIVRGAAEMSTSSTARLFSAGRNRVRYNNSVTNEYML